MDGPGLYQHTGADLSAIGHTMGSLKPPQYQVLACHDSVTAMLDQGWFPWIDAAMPWTLDYSVTDSILTVKCDGRFSAEDLLPMTQAATEKMLAEQTLRVLLDFSTAIANVPIADLYKLPDIYADTRVPRRARLALIVPTDGYRMDIYQFYEDVCVNRGFFVKLFNDVASAKTWLMET
jgi:hypothetical protein